MFADAWGIAAYAMIYERESAASAGNFGRPFMGVSLCYAKGIMKLMFRVLVVATLACTVNPMLTRARGAAPGTLRIATEGDFRPFNFLGPDKKLTGFEVELATAIARKLGLKAEWSTHSFDELLVGLRGRRYDLVAASHAITPERAKLVEFIDPHYCTGAIIVVRPGAQSALLKDLDGKKVGVSAGTTYFERLKAMSRFESVKSYADDAAAMRALLAGETDAWITDRFFAAQAVKKNEGKLVLGQLLFPEMIAMAVAKENRALRDRVNSALAALVKDGTYQRLSLHYFNQNISCRDLSRNARSAVGGF